MAVDPEVDDQRFDPRNIQDAYDKKLTPQALHQSETNPDNSSSQNPDYNQTNDSLGDSGKGFDASGALNDAENSAPGGWSTNVSGSQSNTPQLARLKNLKRLAPIGGVVGVLMAIVAGSGLLLPITLLAGIHSIGDRVTSIVDSVQEARGNQRLKSKFGSKPSAICQKTSYLCRVTTLTEDEFKKVKKAGFELRDANGNTLKPNSNGLYSGASTVYDSGRNKSYSVNRLAIEARTDTKLKSMLMDVYPSRYAALKDARAKYVKRVRRAVSNPKLTEGTDKDKEKNVARNLSAAQRDSNGALIDVDSDILEGVQPEMDKLEQSVASGSVTSGAGTIVEVAQLPEPPSSFGSKIRSGIKSALIPTPVDAAITFCSGVNASQIIVRKAKLIATAAAIAYATQLMSTIERPMAGLESSDQSIITDDISKIFTTFYKPNSTGDTFGDSAGYSGWVYSALSGLPVESGMTGGVFLTALVTFLMYLKKASIGGRSALDACRALVSPAGEITAIAIGLGGALITGGLSSLGSAVTSLGVKKGLKLAAENFVKNAIKSVTEKFASRQALKAISKDVVKKAAGIAGAMLVSYLAGKFIFPYLARIATGTIISGDANGVASMDTFLMGLTALTGGIGLARGLTVISKKSYAKQAQFAKESYDEYVAYQHDISNPLDLTNPYSTLGSISTQLSPYLAKLNILQYPSLMRNLPNTLASIASPGNWIPNAYAATEAQRQALINSCEQKDIDDTYATDMYCNPIVGFEDVDATKKVSTSEVFNYMKQNNYVDDNGDPVPDSAYEEFFNKCIAGSESKSLSSLVDESERLDPECSSQNYNAQQSIKYFRLMAIDKSIDEGFADTGGGNTTNAGDASSGENNGGTTDIGAGTGDFTDSGQVKGADAVLYNAKLFSDTFGKRWFGKGWCARVVSHVWHGDGTPYGLNYARNMWEDYPQYVHKDKGPKVGAMIFSTGGNPAGHVTIYLGNNKILNDGYIVDADYLWSNWGQKYVGWMDPNDVGWVAKRASSTNAMVGDLAGR